MADYSRKIVLDLLARNRAKGEIAAFRRNITSTKKTMKRVAMGALSLAGIGGFGYLAKSMVGAASTAEETQAKFDTVFKDLASQANTWAISFGRSVGRSEQDVKSWMAGLQDTFVPLGVARQEAMGLSQSLVQLGVDVASFNNKADADVIRDFTSALVGNHETVRKYGIIISETAIKQEAMRQGIDKTYKKLTDLEKVQLRYNLILRGTEDAQGDALRTGDSYANQVKRLNANLDDLRVDMGQELLPTFTDFVRLLNDSQDEMAALAKGIMAPVKSMIYLIDIIKSLNEIMAPREGQPRVNQNRGFYYAFPQTRPGGLPEGKLEISPKGYQRLAEMRANLRRMEEQKKITVGEIPEVIRFEEPDWLKEILALNKRTEDQAKAADKAGRAIYEMMMKARGLNDELARQKEIAEFAAQANVAYGADTEVAAMMVERFKAALEATDLKKQLEEEKRLAEEAAQKEREIMSARGDAYRHVFGRMGRVSKRVYDAQRQSLKALYDDYKKLGVAVKDLNVWLAEEQRILAIDYLKMSGGIAGGFAAAGMQIRHEIDTWGERAFEFALTFERSIAQGLENTMRDFDNWRDHLLNVFEEVYWSAVRIAFIQPLAGTLAAGMATAAGALFPGAGGSAAAAERSYNEAYGAQWTVPAQHGGVFTRPTRVLAGEVPEAFVPLRSGRIPVQMTGGGSQRTEFHLHYHGQQQFEVTSEQEYVFSDRRIIEVWMREAQTNLKMRRTIQQSTR